MRVVAETSAEVTNWPERLALTVVMVAIIALACYGMWRGWRNRARRQADLVELPAVPDQPGKLLAAADGGRYIGTVRDGDWLDRIVAHGLGAPGRASVIVTTDGLLIDRDGEPAIFVPAADLHTVTTGKGLAGEVLEKDGIAVFTWTLGDARLATGFRADRATDQRAVLDAAAGLITQTAGKGVSS